MKGLSRDDAEIAMLLLFYGHCTRMFPDLHAKSAMSYQEWRIKNAQAVARIEASAEYRASVERARDEVAVPATGAASVSVPLLRGSVPRPSIQGVLLVAETLDGDVAQAATATTVVSVAPALDVLPPLHRYLICAGAALLAAAAPLSDGRLMPVLSMARAEIEDAFRAR